MDIHYIFPTAILQDNRKDLAEYYLPIAKEYIQKYGYPYFGNENHITTHSVVSNNYTSDILSDPRLELFVKYIYELTDEFLKFQRIDRSNLVFHQPMIVFNKISKNGYHVSHTHPNSLISGCFYLDVPEDSSNIVFKDPRDYHKYIQFSYNYSEGSGDVHCLSPELHKKTNTGDVLIWNSWLEHAVTASKSDKDRYTMVFNIHATI